MLVLLPGLKVVELVLQKATLRKELTYILEGQHVYADGYSLEGV